MVFVMDVEYVYVVGKVVVEFVIVGKNVVMFIIVCNFGEVYFWIIGEVNLVVVVNVE